MLKFIMADNNCQVNNNYTVFSHKYYYIGLYYRDPIPNKRINPCEIARTLQKSDRALLPSSTSFAPSDLEELSTTLGASLDTSSHLFADFKILIYAYNNNLKFACT